MPSKTFGFVRSTQIFFTTLGMFVTNQSKLFGYILSGVLMLSALALYYFHNDYAQNMNIFWQYYKVKSLLVLNPKDASTIVIFTIGTDHYAGTYDMFVHSSWIMSIVSQFWTDIIVWVIVDLVLAGAIFMWVFYYFAAKGKELKDNKFIRGMRLESNEELITELKAKKLAGPFNIPALAENNSQIKIPFTIQFERAHLLAHGTTGSGKGQFFMHLLEQIEEMGDKVIVYDKGCTFARHFFNPARGDIILNPFDERCANWDMWQDAPTSHLLDNMAAALIPQHAGTADPFWVNAARVIFASVAQVMSSFEEDSRTIEKLLEVLLIKKLDNLAAYLKNTEAATLSDEKIEKMAISIRSILVTYCRSLRYLIPINQKHKGENKFSIRRWLQDKNQKGWLFITCRDEEKDVLKPLISLWLDTAVSVLMSMPEDYKGRTWFLYDEIASLQKLPSLSTGLAEIRKFGGCMALGMQSFSQLQNIYGRDEAQAIFSLLNTRLFFRSPDADTAKLVSSELGEQEIEEAKESYSYGTSNIRDGISLVMQKTMRRLVDYAEVMTLGDLEFYLRLLGDLPVTKVKLVKNITRPIRAEPFILHLRDGVSPIETELDQVDARKGSKIDTEHIRSILEGKEIKVVVTPKTEVQKTRGKSKTEVGVQAQEAVDLSEDEKNILAAHPNLDDEHLKNF